MFKSDQGWDDNCYMAMTLQWETFGDNDTGNVGNNDLADGDNKDDMEH